MFTPGVCGGWGVGGGLAGRLMRRPAAWGHGDRGRAPVPRVPLQLGRADK